MSHTSLHNKCFKAVVSWLSVRKRASIEMAAASFADDLTCSICLTIFTNPVTLLCGHSFCRTCLTDFLDTHLQCPQCRTPVAFGKEVAALSTNFILLSLAEKAKHADGIDKEHMTAKVEVAEMCPEHDEKLKLYCVTDQQLTCIICRDGERHEGHTFKPIKEAAASVKRELGKGLDRVSGDIETLESLLSAQREKIMSNRGRSFQLLNQISAEFAEMHRFLQKREKELKDEVKRQEDKDVVHMTKMVNAMEAGLSQNRELQAKAAQVLEVSNPEKFLRACTEGAGAMLQEAFPSKVNEYSLVESTLSLGPYESHLKFFVWKEMLQVIEPREQQLVLKGEERQNNVSVDRRSLRQQQLVLKGEERQNVSVDGHSLLHGPYAEYRNLQRSQPLLNTALYHGFGTSENQFTSGSHPLRNTALYHAFATSVNQFTSGKHYWEIEVGQIGQGGLWEVGIQDHIITCQDGKLSTSCPQGVTLLSLPNIPQKIGIYLNLSSQQLSFYDATNMTHINTVSTKGSKASAMSAYLKIHYSTPNVILFKVCCY
ncbi:tripartite motif containing 108 [Vanacampus margaritifer]